MAEIAVTGVTGNLGGMGFQDYAKKME
jgi:hypothetical protein